MSKDILYEDKAVLNKLYNSLNKTFFKSELPDAAITTQPAKKNNLGHFSRDRWIHTNEEDEIVSHHEININPLNFGIMGPLGVVVTLHHEMVHLANFIKNIKDVAKNGVRHNKKFSEACEEYQLYCIESGDKRGYETPAKLEEQTVAWQQWYKLISEELGLDNRFKISYAPKPIKFKPEKPNVKYVCIDTGERFNISMKQARLLRSGDVDFEIRSPYTGGKAEEYER